MTLPLGPILKHVRASLAHFQYIGKACSNTSFSLCPTPLLHITAECGRGDGQWWLAWWRVGIRGGKDSGLFQDASQVRHQTLRGDTLQIKKNLLVVIYRTSPWTSSRFSFMVVNLVMLCSNVPVVKSNILPTLLPSLPLQMGWKDWTLIGQDPPHMSGLKLYHCVSVTGGPHYNILLETRHKDACSDRTRRVGTWCILHSDNTLFTRKVGRRRYTFTLAEYKTSPKGSCRCMGPKYLSNMALYDRR